MSKRVIDYAFKSYVLKEHNDLLCKARKSSLYDYATYQRDVNGLVLPILRRNESDLTSVGDLIRFCKDNDLYDEFLECHKINNANYKKIMRLKERISSILLNTSDCLFLTLTFNDTTLATTSEKQRRVAVSRYLKSFNAPYVANIDFGSKNHREHYHAIIGVNRIDFSKWCLGAINCERIRNRNIELDKTRLAKYICKLSNHAIKETTKRTSLIYSR